MSQSAVPCQGKSRIELTVPHGQLPAGLSARGKCGVREPLKRLQKYMDQYNIDSEAECTFDQPADDQRFQFKSVHDVEPERAQGQADYIFRQSAQDGAAAACTGTVQDQAAYGAQKPVAERKPREIGKPADQTS